MKPMRIPIADNSFTRVLNRRIAIHSYECDNPEEVPLYNGCFFGNFCCYTP